MKLPPIKLVRMYANNARKGPFVLVAKPLPAAIRDAMTDEEYVARREAEQRAIALEWAKVDAS